MNPIGGKTTPDDDAGLDMRSVCLAIEELRTLLTVSRGHGQLLKRRLRRRIGQQGDLFESLAAIETASGILKTRLRALADQASGA